MAGDPVSFSTGKRVSGIHLLPCEISAADYDYYCLAEDPEGHTYHNVGKKRGNEYRPDGAVELRKEEDNYVVTQIEDGEWMNYTVSIPTDGDYTVYLVYQSKGNSLLSVASDSEVKTEPMQLHINANIFKNNANISITTRNYHTTNYFKSRRYKNKYL